jgi:hypothetical protein
MAVIRSIQKEPVENLGRQQLVDRRRVVSLSPRMPGHDGLKHRSFEIGPGERSRIEKHLPDIVGKRIPVPDPEMQKLVPAEKKSLRMQRGEKSIDAH